MYDLIDKHQRASDLSLAINKFTNVENINLLTNLENFERLQNNTIIQYQNEMDYIIPCDKEKLLGQELYFDLNILLKKILAINNNYIDKNLFKLKVELNLDENIITIKEKLLLIAQSYVHKRMNKANSKDKNPIHKTIRLHRELLPNLSKIALIENSINSYMLRDMLMYISREFSNLISEESIHKKSDIVKLLNINTDIKDDEVSIIKKEIYDISLKIKRMKVILQKYDLENIGIIKNKLYISWNWQYQNHNIGQIVDVSDNQNIEVNISYCGLFVDTKNNLVNTEFLYQKLNNIQIYKVNLYILQKIHIFFTTLCTNEDINQYENKIILDNVNLKDESTNNFDCEIIEKKESISRKLHVTTKKLKSFIESIGFIEVSRSGSHIKYRNSKLNKTCTFANKKDTFVYKMGSLKKILKDYNQTYKDLELFIGK